VVRRERAARRVATGSVLAVLALLLSTGIVLATSSLAVSPSHGQAADSVTITYQTDATGCPGATVRFGWDGQALTSGSFGRTCSISIAVTPPAGGDAVGRHLVDACMMSVTGACIEMTSLSGRSWAMFH